jgi:hypothetical protein
MDTKSRILFWVLALLIVASVSVTYYRIMIKRDYVIESQFDCDPYEKACFVWQCDPTSTVEGEACKGNPDEDIWYYALAKRKAANIPLCDPKVDENCDPWTCSEGEKDCSETFCDQTTKIAQKVECSDPVQYAIDNPVEEQSDCAPDDAECLAGEEAAACEEGDEECLAAQESTCAEDDEECLAAQEETKEVCAEGDVECSGEVEEVAPATKTVPAEIVPSETVEDVSKRVL